MWTHTARFGRESFVEILFGSNHFARIRFDASDDRAVSGLDRKGIVDGLELATLEKFHDDDDVVVVFGGDKKGEKDKSEGVVCVCVKLN